MIPQRGQTQDIFVSSVVSISKESTSILSDGVEYHYQHFSKATL